MRDRTRADPSHEATSRLSTNRPSASLPFPGCGHLTTTNREPHTLNDPAFRPPPIAKEQGRRAFLSGEGGQGGGRKVSESLRWDSDPGVDTCQQRALKCKVYILVLHQHTKPHSIPSLSKP